MSDDVRVSGPDNALACSRWVDQVADEFEAAWKDGKSPAIADFMEGATGKPKQTLLLELVKLDLEYRSSRGERIRIDNYLQQFPELQTANGTIDRDLILYARQVSRRSGCNSTRQGGSENPGAIRRLGCRLGCRLWCRLGCRRSGAPCVGHRSRGRSGGRW